MGSRVFERAVGSESTIGFRTGRTLQTQTIQVVDKALLSATQLSGAQSTRSLRLSVSASAAQILIADRERKLALIFALKIE